MSAQKVGRVIPNAQLSGSSHALNRRVKDNPPYLGGLH